MKRTTEELEQLVVSLQSQLDFAKISELNLVSRIETLASEKQQMADQLEKDRTAEREAAYRLAYNTIQRQFDEQLQATIEQATEFGRSIALTEIEQDLRRERTEAAEVKQQLESEVQSLKETIQGFESLQKDTEAKHTEQLFRVEQTTESVVRGLQGQIDELSQKVASLETDKDNYMLSLTRAKEAELILVDQIRGLGQELSQTKNELAARQVIDTEAVYRRAKTEYEAEAKVRDARREVAWKNRLATEAELLARQIAEGQMEVEREENLQFRKQVGEELRVAQEQVATSDAEVVRLTNELQSVTRESELKVVSIEQQLAAAKQAIVVEFNLRDVKISALTKELEEAQKTLAFMKIAEQDLVNRWKATLAESDLRNDRIITLTKELEESQKELAFMKIAERELVNRWKAAAENLDKERAAHMLTHELLTDQLSRKDAIPEKMRNRKMHTRPGE